MLKFFWSRSSSLPMSLLYILLGLVLLIFPGMSGTVFCWALAAAAFAYAVSRFWFFRQARKEGVTASGTLTLGIIVLAFGIFCLVRPDSILSFLPLTLGIVLLLDGIGKLPLLFDALAARNNRRIPLALASLVPLALGIVLIVNPFGAAKTVIRFFGIALLADGIFDFVTAVQVRRAEKAEYKDVK